MNRAKARRIANRVVWTSAAVLFLGLVFGLLGWAMYSLQQGAARRDFQIDRLVQIVQQDRAETRVARARNRRVQAALQDKLDASLATQRNLLAYLERHGLNPPARFVTVKRPRVVVVQRATRRPHRAHKRHAHRAKPHVVTPGHGHGHAYGWHKHHH